MAKIEAAIQGIDRDFNFTGSYDAIELGEITLAQARESMRKLPDEGGVTPEYREGKEGLCPPSIHLSSSRIVMKKGFLRKKEKAVEEPFNLSIVGGQERGKLGVLQEGDREVRLVSFSEADEIVRDFFKKASEEPAFSPDL